MNNVKDRMMFVGARFRRKLALRSELWRLDLGRVDRFIARWAFVGPTAVFAFNDRVEGCVVRGEVERARREFVRPAGQDA
jgi:hypothetical protein